jgi:hypothetical protein
MLILAYAKKLWGEPWLFVFLATPIMRADGEEK